MLLLEVTRRRFWCIIQDIFRIEYYLTEKFAFCTRYNFNNELDFAASSIPGHTLNITKVNRVHMGAYQCIADNGIPPAANATYNVEVHCECLHLF